jgi:diguanylate cyclase (GGDEF)-like protein
MVRHPAASPLSELGHLVRVEAAKRRLILASVSLFGVILLLVYGLAHISNEEARLGTFYLVCGLVCTANLIYLCKSKDHRIPLAVLNTTLGGICVVLLYRGISEGFEPYWLFPALSIGLLINRFSHAVTYAVLLVASTLSAYMLAGESLFSGPFAENSALRLLLSLSGMSCIVLVATYRTERASKLLNSLHQEDIHRLAYFDSLTGLANRPSYVRWLEKTLQRAQHGKADLAVLYVDLDNFKQVNDRYGHRQGDQVLVEFGNRLADCVRPHDGTTRLYSGKDVARLAGDEFVVTLPNVREPADAARVARRILDLFAGGFTVNGVTHPISASIGITFSERTRTDAETLLNQADSAMYHAKQSGKNKFCFYSATIANTVEERHAVEEAIQLALRDQLFSLHYMPILDSRSLGVVGVEALLRSTHPLLEDLGPERFIPVAESSGQIRLVDAWVVEHAVAMQARLRASSAYTGRMCINLSAVELHNKHLPNILRDALKNHGVDAADIELEITETALVSGDEVSVETLRRLRELGVSICLDDFGTGYTAFSQLMNYPVSTLKIDKSFVRNLFSEESAHKKMTAMLKRLAELYELRVVAEGVETPEQLKYLRRIGCEYVQGFYLAQPMAAELLLGQHASAWVDTRDIDS